MFQRAWALRTYLKIVDFEPLKGVFNEPQNKHGSELDLGRFSGHIWDPKIPSKQVKNDPKSSGLGPPKEPKKPRGAKDRFFKSFKTFLGVQGCQNRVQNVKKCGSIFADFLVWVSRCIFRDLGSKMDTKLVQFVVKIVVRRDNVHI